MISVRIDSTKDMRQGGSCHLICGTLLCVFILVVGLLVALGLPKIRLANEILKNEPIAIIEDLDNNKKIAVGRNDTIGGNIQVLGVENGKIRLVVREN